MRETSRGYHWLGTYKQCPRRWWLRYNQGIREASSDTGTSIGQWFAELRRRYFEDPEMVGESWRASPTDPIFVAGQLLQQWLEAYGKSDQQTYICRPELPLETGLAGWRTTCRLDLGLEAIHGLTIIETKTTRRRMVDIYEAVLQEDQALHYWCMAKSFGYVVLGVVPEIIEYHCTKEGALKPDLTRINRFPIRTFTHVEESLYRVESKEWHDRLNEDVNGREDRIAFPANRHACRAYGRPCEFIGICRTYQPGDNLPQTLKRDPT